MLCSPLPFFPGRNSKNPESSALSRSQPDALTTKTLMKPPFEENESKFEKKKKGEKNMPNQTHIHKQKKNGGKAGKKKKWKRNGGGVSMPMSSQR